MGTTNEPFNPTVGDLSLTSREPREIPSDEKDTGSATFDAAQATQDPTLRTYLNIASLANLANVHKTGDEWHARGDPTEIAIQVYASRFNWNRLRLAGGDQPEWRQVTEFPFDSDTKKMSVVFQHVASHDLHVFTKGAVERVISSCETIAIGGEDGAETSIVPITDEHVADIMKNMESLARMGLRVLAFANRENVREISEKEQPERNEFEAHLTFRGLIGLYDPPRPESAESVHLCQQAGISVHMLTGDHPETARAIAIEVGILPKTRMAEIPERTAKTMVMAASEFDKLTDDEVDALPNLPLVVARCAPNTKVRMISALHRRGKFVAMTGDGVNDSPSLKSADVGIAMGQAGSDVAKEAADIVLTDDNFASILNAVEEGKAFLACTNPKRNFVIDPRPFANVVLHIQQDAACLTTSKSSSSTFWPKTLHKLVPSLSVSCSRTTPAFRSSLSLPSKFSGLLWSPRACPIWVLALNWPLPTFSPGHRKT